MSALSRVLRICRSLPRRRQRQLKILAVGLVFGAVADMATIGMTVPFISVLADLDSISRFPAISHVLAALGADTPGRIAVLLTVLFGTLAVLAAVTRITLEYALHRFVFRASYDFGVAVFYRILNQPYGYHIQRNSAESVAVIDKLQWVSVQFLLPWLEVGNACVIAAGVFVALMLVNWQVAVAIFGAMAGIYVLVGMVTRPLMRRTASRISAMQKRRVQIIQESLGGIRDVILDRSQAAHLRRFSTLDLTFRDAQALARVVASGPRFIVQALAIVVFAGITLWLSLTAGDLAKAMPTLAAFAIGAQRILPMIQQLHAGLTKMRSSEVIVDEILELLNLPTPDEETKDVEPLPFERELRLDAVTFRYSDDRPPALTDVSLAIPKGARVGIVGPTGSGKSTLVDVIMGLLEPSSGQVLVDGVPLVGPDLLRWRRCIAHVPQTVFLADTSIRENIASDTAPHRIDDQRVIRAATQVGLHDVIAALPHGYETHVGERGIRFSGGQRQRLVIARALYRDPAVLVLDEATSALDTQTEREIMKEIGQLRADLTIIMIAHRVSTLAGCDSVLCIEDGRVARIGSFAEAIATERSSGIRAAE